MNNCILLSHWNGRIGNRLHQYAYGTTYAKKNNVRFLLFDRWEGDVLFKNKTHEILTDEPLRNKLCDFSLTFDERYGLIKEAYPDAQYVNPDVPEQCYKKYDVPAFFDSVCAYNQCIFDEQSSAGLIDLFEFSDRIKNLPIYKKYEEIKGTYDVAHLRRDDIATPEYNKTNLNFYSVISIKSYKDAFKKFGYDENKIIWITDDRTGQWIKDPYTDYDPVTKTWGRPKVTPGSEGRPLKGGKDNTEGTHNKKVTGGWSYPVGSEIIDGVVFDWLEDFLKMYFARSVFRANSSFSWWACCLSPTAKVFSPVVQFKHSRYGVDSLDEIDVEYTEGNNNHWTYTCEPIIFKDDPLAVSFMIQRKKLKSLVDQYNINGIKGLYSNLRNPKTNYSQKIYDDVKNDYLKLLKQSKSN